MEVRVHVCWQNSVNAWNLEVPLGTSYLVFSSPNGQVGI
jgi:hypothetical protein